MKGPPPFLQEVRINALKKDVDDLALDIPNIPNAKRRSIIYPWRQRVDAFQNIYFSLRTTYYKPHLKEVKAVHVLQSPLVAYVQLGGFVKMVNESKYD